MGGLTGLERFNQQHPWSHNDRFIGWVARRVGASGARDVLDVGCGTGNLVDRLRQHARVVGLEPDPATAASAARRFDTDPQVIIEARSFAERDLLCCWDAITMLAVLHHLPLDTTLRELRRVLRPGGRLVVVGCYREAGVRDVVLGVLSVLANPVVGVVKHPTRARMLPENMRSPTAPVTHTLSELSAAVGRELPGARIRRRLFWRYTLIYDAP